MDRAFAALVVASVLTAAVSLILLSATNTPAALDALIVGGCGLVGWTLIWIGVTWIRQALFPKRDG